MASWRMVQWVNDLLPELDSGTDRVTGVVFTSEHENIAVCCDHFIFYDEPLVLEFYQQVFNLK